MTTQFTGKPANAARCRFFQHFLPHYDLLQPLHVSIGRAAEFDEYDRQRSKRLVFEGDQTGMWVKVCGLKTVENSLEAVEAGVDAIGLNFFERSRRFVQPSVAALISQALVHTSGIQSGPDEPVKRLSVSNRRVDIVGLFVNASPRFVCETVDQAGLTAVQFHGDETVQEIADCHQRMPEVAIVRAMRVNSQTIDAVVREADELLTAIPNITCLLDAFVTGQYGGTGCTLDANTVKRFKAELPQARLIVAGGLTPENVSMAVNQLQPWGVDTASGVETEPGVKSPEKVRQFTVAAKL